MALKDIQIPKADVSVGAGGSFAVRGLSTTDIEHFTRECGPELHQLWNDYVNGKLKPEEALSETGMRGMFAQIVKECPRLVVSVISHAADAADDEERKIVERLPVAVQVDALLKIAMQTLNVEGDLGKLIGTVVTALGSMNAFTSGLAGELAKS